jgi:DNA-binding transcriptional ArsR family regulator
MHDQLQSNKCARLLKALADPYRLKIVQCLQSGPKNVSELAELLAEELANVSHHLAVMRHAGLVRDEKHGKFIVYSLHPAVFRPAQRGTAADALDLGCCRIELGSR